MEKNARAHYEQMVSIDKKMASQKVFISDFEDKVKEKPEIIQQLKIRIDKMNDWCTTYFNNFGKLMEILPEDSNYVQQLHTKLAEFDELYFEVISAFNYHFKRFDETKPTTTEKIKNDEASSSSCAIQLPKVELPHFDGELDKWIRFKTTFYDLVTNNPKLTNIQRFHYLNGVLGDKAKKVIVKIEFSSDGFVTAWNALCTRFDNNQAIIDSHISKLFNAKIHSKASSVGLQDLLDEINVQLVALENLGQAVDKWDAIIIYLVAQKLDEETRNLWEVEKANSDEDMPSWEAMSNFLQKRCNILMSIESNNRPSRQSHPKQATSYDQPKQRPFPSSKSFVTSTPSTPDVQPCKLCNKTHTLTRCDEFLKLTPQARYKKVRDHFLCINCLRSSHTVKNCTSSMCRICRKKHNTLLHMDQSNDTNATTSIDTTIQENTKTTSNAMVANTNVSESPQNQLTLCLCDKNANKQVLLSTALVLIEDSQRKFTPCRALLDSASQSNFISAALANKLKIPLSTTTPFIVSGINNNKTHIKHKLTTNIASRVTQFKTSMAFLIVPEISSTIPSSFINISKWEMPSNIVLADPEFNIPGTVDILIGAEMFFSLIENHQIELASHLPILRKSAFGYIVSGKVETPCQHEHNFFLSDQSDLNIDNQLKLFWEIESLDRKPLMTLEEKACESKYEITTTKNENGRYIVRLPFKHSSNDLGDSRQVALKRFSYLEKRLQNNPDLNRQYIAFMQEYQSLGHMKLSTTYDKPSTNEYLIPHHAVCKPTSTTTKIRVVFDASSKSSSGKSLNDLLMIGPVVQSSLFDIILRFRKYQFVFTSDIEKMYRQILVHPDDTPFQKIFWRETPTDKIQEFELQTVTYGTASAPYLATRTINQLATDSADKYPLASKIAITDCYVDDILSGSDSYNEALQSIIQLQQMFKDAGMNLRKWTSNNPALLQHFPDDFKENTINETIRALGLIWHPKEDIFMFQVQLLSPDVNITKRTMLSDILKIFDPLGLIGPIIVIARCLIQQLWLQKIEWDETIPSTLHGTWINFRDQLSAVNDIRLNRCIIPNRGSRIQLHGFADASKSAYGACIYIRSIDDKNNVTVNLLCSRSRIAPLKTITIPRLELMAAVLLSKLAVQVIAAINIKFEKIVLWTDSKITLSWIQLPPSRLTNFVAHRTTEIQELTAEMEWRHVKGKINPADVISRGCMPRELQTNQLWWFGPSFLSTDEEQWPTTKIHIDETKLTEVQESTFALITTLVEDTVNISSFSRYLKLQRSVAYCIRFIRNCRIKSKDKGNRKTGDLTASELKSASKSLIRIVQHQAFDKYIQTWEDAPGNGKKDGSNFSNLSPFVDPDGLVRVGGRIHHSTVTYDTKHPYLLPKHHFTELVIRHIHQQNLHSGVQSTLATMRQQFWPVYGTNAVKKVIQQCITCYRVKPRMSHQIMGNLPSSRMEVCRPFNTTGIDYCGPFYVKHKLQRKNVTSKMYVCIFICFSIKAVHLELVEDASTPSFIACLKRFLARRGKVSTLWSDNGSNFKGADAELKRLFQQFHQESNNDIQTLCANEGIEWKFIPPRSPHMGGLWESAVKIFKLHLKKTLGTQEYKFEQLHTIVVQIEGIMNSRPLTVLSSDDDDLQPLTPGHFTTGGPINCILEPPINLPENRLKYWQIVTQTTQRFWQRFSKEYLQSLQSKKKWVHDQHNLQINDIVLIHDDNIPPTKWLLGRITDTIRGSDGKIRIVHIKTKVGEIKRAITKLSKLPIEDNKHN